MPLRSLCACLGVLAYAATVLTAATRPADITARARGANRVMVAEVTDVTPRFDVNEHGDRLIISRVLLQVEETLKGTASPIAEMDVEGGTIGDLTLKVSDLPVVTRGERGVFFLSAATAGVHRPNGRGDGILKLDASNRVAGDVLSLSDVRAAVRSARP
jgi:hypothetical protein